MSPLIHRTSLSKTVDAVNEAFFFGKTIPAADRREIARWIAARHAVPGNYCCGKCTVGMWRNVMAGGLDRQSERLGLGLKALHARRDGDGGWKTFPFWYTVLALTEMNHPGARVELAYAADRIRGEALRSRGTSPYSDRRKAVARRACEALGTARFLPVA